MKLHQINDFKVGKPIMGFFLCNEKEVKKTRNGDLFLNLQLSDKTGTVYGKMWNHIDVFNNRFKKGDIVAVKGIPEKYKNELELIITNINIGIKSRYEKYGLNPKSIIPTTKTPIKTLWKELLVIIKNVSNTHLKKILNNIFKENRSIIEVLPVKIDNHILVRGGFLEKIVSAGKLANRIKNHYKNIDADLLVAATLLWDICKIKALSGGLETDYKTTNELIENRIINMDIIKTAILNVEGFPQKITDKLEYIIITKDRESIKNNKKIDLMTEALLVELIYKIDGTFNN